MTQERFLQLMENPDLLSTIPYEELKTMAFAYPFAHNLRYLLALKSQQEDHPQFKRNLATAAAYSIDRSRLLALVAPKLVAPQAIPLPEKEEMLELRPIETVKRELEALAPVKRMDEPEPQQNELAAPAFSDSTPTVEPGTSAEPEPKETAPVLPPPAPPVQPTVMTPPDNSESGGFQHWIGQFNPPVLSARPKRQLEPDPAPETETPTLQGLSAQQLAEKSVTENKDILSETLARLYAKQGYRDKAVAMYMRLSLAFPEKSAYFAAEIEKLKK